MPNRLAAETSLYLRQHAGNPVDWYPWGPEALQRAKAENRPIFLSIGYSSCHWCHVMAHESFEDPAVADILNRELIAIKVDREERPDLDQIYMDALQALNGQGGWPMSLFLTPDGAPFFGGSYFPAVYSHGTHSFTDVLLAVVDSWKFRRQEVDESARELADGLQQQSAKMLGDSNGTPLRPEVLPIALRKIEQGFDNANGGWGPGPKFPQPMVLEFLLRLHRRSGDAVALNMVSQTLEAMARGGIYDQIGGGFHRYSVDARWLVPHFEKMLYDNAQLARLYLHGWQVTSEPLFRAVAEETLDYLTREMAAPAGGFYSSQNADSEGVEGKYYLWTTEQIRGVLGGDMDPFAGAHGVTTEGNFEGKNILTFSSPFHEREAFKDARARLLAARDSRVHPSRDEKLLTSWNGLAVAAFAEAGAALGRDDYLRTAERTANCLLHEMRTPEGRLWHRWSGGSAGIAGFLDDYSHLIEGLLELYEAGKEEIWLRSAEELAELMVRHFDAETGFYDTADDQEALIVRPRGMQDNALPSGNAMAAYGLLRLSQLGGGKGEVDRALGCLAALQSMLERYPLGFGQWLIALEYAVERGLDKR